MHRSSRKVLGMPVVSLEDGQQVGKVRNLVLDPKAPAVTAIILDKTGFFREGRLIPYCTVKSIGEHAITINDPSSIEKPTDTPELASLVRNPVPVIGARVVTELGTVIGEVEDYVFEAETGKIKALEVSAGFLGRVLGGHIALNVEEIVTLGRRGIIARASAERRLQRTPDRLQASLDSAQESGQQAWNFIFSKPKEKLGNAFNSWQGKVTMKIGRKLAKEPPTTVREPESSIPAMTQNNDVSLQQIKEEAGPNPADPACNNHLANGTSPVIRIGKTSS